MFPRGMIAAGVLLLLLAATGFIYALARKKPPFESLEPVQLQLQAETRAADEALALPPTPPVTKSREHVVVRRRQQPPPIKTFAVRILSPAMAQTFTAPANVTLTAAASRERELTGIEYYQSPEETVCQSLTNPQPLPAELKLGEAHAKPYEVVWNIPKAGYFTVVAVATYEGGEKQISAPVVIAVDPAEPDDGPGWRGWEPAYPKDQQFQQDASLMAAPTPTPNPESCPRVVVNKLPGSPQSDTLNFQAVVSGAEVPADLTFHWNVSAGEIVSGQDTSTISVTVDRILDPDVVVSVEVGHLPAVCSTFGSTSLQFEQPHWVTREFRNRLQQMKEDVAENSDGIVSRYIQLSGERDDCVDQELLNDALLLKRYFVEYRGLDDKDVVIVNAGHSDEGESLNLELMYGGYEVSDELQKSLKRPLVPCRSSRSVAAGNIGTPINRACPDIDEVIQYDTAVFLGSYRINTCPYNSRDPLNSKTQITLSSSVAGVYSNYPSIKYWVNAGKLLRNRPNGIWELSEVKLRPRRYAAIAVADDGCGCTNVNTEPVAVTNYCSPCLTMSRTCSPALNDEGLQFYRATIANFAVAEKTTFHWTTSKGKIIRGQGSADIVIDTKGLAPGEQFEVTVAAGGLMRYCANTVTQTAVVEAFPCRIVATFPNFAAGRDEQRRAHRRPPSEEEIVQSTTGNEATTGRPGEGPVHVNHAPPRANEKDLMKLSWTPRVKTDDPITIKVAYNRTTESFQVSNTAGEISEELKLAKPLKEYFGADYQTLGDIRLQAPGLKRDSYQEQYQSFDEDKLEWEWVLRPDGSGTYYFDVELWIKGEPRTKAADKPSMPAKKVWSETKNRIDVTPPFMTRPKVYAGVGMCAVLGFGLCVRGFKAHLHIGDTYNVGQAGVVGHNVTLTNTTVNQEATNNNLQNGEKHDV